MTAPLDLAVARGRLVEDLTGVGALRSPDLITAFARVPREVFVPHYAVRAALGTVHYDRSVDPHGWASKIYTDQTLITVIDAGGTAVSSSSTPSVMALMLEALDVRAGMRVLELGTGTGYNAALLCHIVGDENVVSVDVDGELVESARWRLAELGYRPQLCVADATAPLDLGTFDRVIVTFGSRRLPGAALGVLARGGVVVANLGAGLYVGRPNDTGGVCGHFHRTRIAFMRARRRADAVVPNIGDTVAALMGLPDRSATVRAEPRVDWEDAWFAGQLVMPTVERMLESDHDGRRVCGLVDHATGSWAHADVTNREQAVVSSSGPRDLWTEYDQVVRWWLMCGRPAPERFGVSIDMDAVHRLWIDHPTGQPWPLP